MFLSLILLMVLAVIMTTVEAARVNAASALSFRTLTTGLDSVMAEYYAPLYKEYHVFGLDAGYGSSDINEDVINNNLIHYMEYTFQPEKELGEDSIKNAYLKLHGLQSLQNIQSIEDITDIQNLQGIENIYDIQDLQDIEDIQDLDRMQDIIPDISDFGSIQNLYNINIESTNVKKITTLLEYNGELFEKQALEYMKYKIPIDTVTSFLNNASTVEDTSDCAEILEEQEETQAKVQALNSTILKLLEKIDGITITNKGIKIKSNQVVVKEYFVKKLQGTPVSMSSVHINNEWLFGSLKSHYRDVNGEINMVINKLEQFEAINSNIQSIEQEIALLIQVDASKMTKEEKDVYKVKLEQLEIQLSNQVSEKKTRIEEINRTIQSTRQQIDGVLKTTKEAIQILEEGQGIQQEVTKEIVAYEELVKTYEGKVDEGFYSGLAEGAEMLSQYKGSEALAGGNQSKNSNYDFSSMIPQLRANENILNKSSNMLLASLNDSEESVAKVRMTLTNFVHCMGEYNTQNFKFDYSTLTKPEDSDPFFNQIKSLIQNGIMELVVQDTKELSNKEITSDNLPSDLIGRESTSLEDEEDLTQSIDMEKGSDLLGKLNPKQIADSAIDLGEKAINLIIYQEYLKEHFGFYNGVIEEEQKALSYELEYILKGNDKDVDNLYEVVMQILSIRTILNLISLLTDTTKTNEARLLAASFVGFTGMPILVEAVKMIILTLWALVESFVDITALLMGKSVPVIKVGKGIQIQLAEIMGTNKLLIQNKAKNFKDNKTPIDLTYKDYLTLFLFWEKKEARLFRTMDVIQENLQKNYSEEFYMRNCITGLGVTGIFTMETKFIQVPFVSSYLTNYDTDGYRFTFTREYTY